MPEPTYQVAILVFGGEMFGDEILGTNSDYRCRLADQKSRQLETDGWQVTIVAEGAADHPGQIKPTGFHMAKSLRELDVHSSRRILWGGDGFNTHENIWSMRRILRHERMWGTWRPLVPLYVVSERLHCRRIQLSFLLLFATRVKAYPTHDIISKKAAWLEHFFLLVHLFDPFGLGLPKLMKWHRQKKRRNAQSI